MKQNTPVLQQGPTLDTEYFHPTARTNTRAYSMDIFHDIHSQFHECVCIVFYQLMLQTILNCCSAFIVNLLQFWAFQLYSPERLWHRLIRDFYIPFPSFIQTYHILVFPFFTDLMFSWCFLPFLNKPFVFFYFFFCNSNYLQIPLSPPATLFLIV